jgi:hypothetical protein
MIISPEAMAVGEEEIVIKNEAIIKAFQNSPARIFINYNFNQ